MNDGLDKDARLAEERRRAAEERRRKMRLNAPFPLRVVAPDLSFFLTREPSPREAGSGD